MAELSSMLTVSLYAMLFQNLIFGPAFGMSESIRMAKRPKHLVMYGGFFLLFSLVTSGICHFIYKSQWVASLEYRFTFIIDAAVLAAVYLACAAICKFTLKADKKFMNSLGMCAFNTLIIAIPTINLKSGHSFLESIGLAVGACLAFVLSMLLILAGMKMIHQSKNIPEAFSGTPALFIYVSIIALSLSCISSGSLFV